MDFKSMLIGGLGTALLFVSVGAGNQQETLPVQVSHNPHPFTIDQTTGLLINRANGNMWSIHDQMTSKTKKLHTIIRPVTVDGIEK